MSVSIDQLLLWMEHPESERLEFKEAKNNFSAERLVVYCCAIANEGGGRVIFGVSDKRPRTIVGSQAFLNLIEIKSELIEKLHLRIDAEDLYVDGRRVVVFTIPARPIGKALSLSGIHWMRRGESLVPMTDDMLKRILNEDVVDFSAQICLDATMKDLDLTAISRFREMWIRKSGNESLRNYSDEKLLQDSEVLLEKGLTYAALILFGTKQALGKHLAQAEVVFEYRSSQVTGPAQQRIEFRQGFFSFFDELWEKINLRNDVQHFQDGLFIWDIPTFNERSIREAILNAISHRDYRAAGSIWVKQYPRTITICSPGGFPSGINVTNILWKQEPRNRRIAETFAKCGLVERAGQGADTMFEQSIRESKPLPNFENTDENEVVLTLSGQVQDESFLRFLERIGQETIATFSAEDFLVLDLVHKNTPVPNQPQLRIRLKRLTDLGIIECRGRGKGAKYMLCRRYYEFVGQRGVYTRKRGLDKATNKELLFRHVDENAKNGAKLSDLEQVLPDLSQSQVQKLLRELKAEGRISVHGKTRGSRWFPAK